MTIKDFFTRKKVVTPTKTVDDKKEGYVKVTEHLRVLYSADITKWRMAHQSAISTINPSTAALQDVYEDTLLDTHLKAVLQQRSLNVLNTPFRFLRNGEVDTELTAAFQKKWVYDVINEIQNSQYYGYTCLEFHFDNGAVKSVKSILRHHIIPQLGELLPNVNLQRGVDITKEPFSGTYVLIDHGSLGLLLEASKYTIFKKYATAHWQQLQQLFGVPMRIGRTNSRDKSVIDNIYNTLKNMGTAGFGVMPEGTLVEIIESGKSDPHKIFQEAINVANNELSMRVLGTPNSDKGGSYAKEKVNYERHNDLTYADLRYVQFIFNDQVIPLLNRWNYDLENVTIEFDPSWSLPLANTQLDVDKWLSEKYDLSEDYIQDTYGVKVEKKKKESELNLTAQTLADLTGLDLSEKKKESELINATETTATLPNWYEVLIKQLYEQKVADGVISQDMYFKTADELWAAVLKEVKSGEQITKANNDVNWLQMQQNNIYAFSAAKSYSEMKTLRDLVFAGTKIRPYTEFRADALKIYGTYNENWLQTERDAVVRGTVMGKKWLNIQRDKDIYPYLQYVTKSDNRVRDEHKTLNGKIFKVDNPIWDIIYPPNGWNCRCTIKQLRSGNEDNSNETLKDFEAENEQTYWHKNVGKNAILDYMDSEYKKEMPVKNKNIDNMDAVKNWGLKTIDAIKAKKAYKDVQTDNLSISEWFDAMYKAQNGKNGIFSIDYDGISAPVSVSKSFVDFIERNAEFEAFITVEFENIILSANEIWSNSDIDTLTFVKYYNDKVIAINVNQDNDGIWFAETVDVDADIVRKGILLMRK